ncbi:hypothetical protein CAOG_08950 [Capsaspora owczarzaki ATCC 30864]|uniref:UBA domain-containing protein n=1 Tax=Capsaspora owczarzaki (strain ATCC 30864) TaxID=595528 RepID=A0A0D2VW37_CAPO3|nr:hypothetical protein CAOG_08950 [Capsaspora owczarzaki ATCC 30864]KJE95722.1 hypothetical protein CAOG_008950 [Capsaspora owczarzaki ATCC 30864]|eukprot:XP_011270621.1 hypothetical protein CAOG_08950 [Capsaspora owczarzaki ATCC 30864]
MSSPRASQPSSPASSVPSSPSAGLYTTAPPLFPPTFLPSSPLPQSASATPSTTTTTTTTTTTSTNQGLTAAAAALAPLASPQRALPQPVEIERQRLYSSALTFLLEADAEFAKCRSDILDNVDNLGLLQLDIVYCYLMLRDVTSLPDATRRLATCEATLKRSYGANLERLRRTREGAVPPEMVFLVRLKLLKAAVLFHETAARRPAASGSNPTAVASAVVSARAECSRLLEEVTREITSMKPDPAAVEQLMTMGLTSTQARVALREPNDVSRALELHFAHRQQEQTHREQHEQSRFNRELQRRLGRTTRGEWVDVNLFQYLHSTGFPKHAAGAALRQANNNLEIAMQLLTTCPQLFAKPTHHRRRTSAAGSSGSAPPSPAARMGTGNLGDLTALLSSMGIYMPAERIQQTLAECDGDLNRAFERLQKEQFGVEDAPATPGSGASATPVDSDDDDDDDGFMDDTEHTRQVIANEILPTISKDSLAYLDMNLDEEESVAHFYQSLLAKLQ